MAAKRKSAPEAAASNGATGAASWRRSGRLSSTGKRSSYFERDEESGSEASGSEGRGGDAQPPRKKARGAAGGKKLMGRLASDDEDEFEDEDGGGEGSDEDGGGDGDEDEDEDEDEEEATPPPPPRKRGRPPKNSIGGASSSKGSTSTAGKAAAAKKKQKLKEEEEEEEGDDDDDDADDDGRQVTFIPRPQLRDTGGVEYEDTRIHPNTLAFLGELRENNQRSWLKMRDPEYRRSLKDWETFVETLTERIAAADDTVPEDLPLKDVVFRIYRDVRFSRDPTPYKPHYSAAWSRTGRKGPYACYYVHAEPGRCFVGGGLWHPDAAALARLRASIDERPHRIRRALMDPAFRRELLPDSVGGGGKKKGAKKQKGGSGSAEEEEEEEEDKVIRAFAACNQENALKTKPKGFHKEHRDMELLKLRNYTVGKKLSDADLTAPDAQDRIMAVVSAMVGYVTFLNSVVMPDPNLDGDSSDDEDEQDGAEDDGEDGEDGDGE